MTALVPFEDAQASFILRLSTVSRLSHLRHIVSPSITHEGAADYNALVEGALESIIVGDGATAAGLPTSKEGTHDPATWKTHTYLVHETLWQAYMPIRKDGLGITSSISINKNSLHRLPRLVRGTCRCSLCPGEPSISSRTTASATHGVSVP